ncbi:hypothetical protein RFI_35302, partial [Reticulomyxa filosa]
KPAFQNKKRVCIFLFYFLFNKKYLQVKSKFFFWFFLNEKCYFVIVQIGAQIKTNFGKFFVFFVVKKLIEKREKNKLKNFKIEKFYLRKLKKILKKNEKIKEEKRMKNRKKKGKMKRGKGWK